MKKDYFTFDAFHYFSAIIQGISNRHFGDMRFGAGSDEAAINNRENFYHKLGLDASEVVAPTLTHGSNIQVVGRSKRGKMIPRADSLLSQDRGVYLMITVADCLPILIYDPVLKIIGLVHAGWRGIIDQIVIKTIEKFKYLGSKSENLIIGIGPGICQRHFVVKNDVCSLFLNFYPSATFVRNNDGYVNLKQAVKIDLKRMGIISDNIEMTNLCPVCDNGIYGSYRKEGAKAPAAAAIIGMKE